MAPDHSTCCSLVWLCETNNPLEEDGAVGLPVHVVQSSDRWLLDPDVAAINRSYDPLKATCALEDGGRHPLLTACGPRDRAHQRVDMMVSTQSMARCADERETLNSRKLFWFVMYHRNMSTILAGSHWLWSLSRPHSSRYL